MQYRLLQSCKRWLLQAFQACPVYAPQVRKVAEENGVDVSTQIAELETRAQQVLLPGMLAEALSPAQSRHAEPETQSFYSLYMQLQCRTGSCTSRVTNFPARITNRPRVALAVPPDVQSACCA